MQHIPDSHLRPLWGTCFVLRVLLVWFLVFLFFSGGWGGGKEVSRCLVGFLTFYFKRFFFFLLAFIGGLEAGGGGVDERLLYI